MLVKKKKERLLLLEAPETISEAAFDKILGERLKKLRKACMVSQVNVGKYLGIHQTAVCRIENGDQTVTPQQLDLLSRLFNVKIDDLIHNDNLSSGMMNRKCPKKM